MQTIGPNGKNFSTKLKTKPHTRYKRNKGGINSRSIWSSSKDQRAEEEEYIY